MATASTPTASLLSLLHRSYPRAVPLQATEVNLHTLTPLIFPTVLYSDAERAEIESWLAEVSRLAESLREGADAEKLGLGEQLKKINGHLAMRTTMLGVKPSVLDVALYAALAPVVEKWTAEQRTGEDGYHHIVRHVDFVQNAELFGLAIPAEEKVAIDLDNVVALPKDEKKAKKEKKGEATVVVGKGKPEANSTAKGEAAGAAAAAAGGEAAAGEKKAKKEKKEKQPRQKPAPAPAAPMSPCVIDLRVGHILRAINHPNADSLYVSTIACGDAPGSDNTQLDEETGLTVRTVCSGLNGLVPLEEMQGRKVVTVCNLKPVTMRGIKSAAMVLAASPRNDDSHAGPVELVTPPEGAEAGERVYFDGWNEGEPEKQLNPKKKMWETFQPGFTTTEGLEVVFESAAVPQVSETAASKPAMGRLMVKSGGVCTVKSLAGATVR
ncbi:GU4 nucleic-binding protein 1 [Nannizzia gypsea CBS 118893]|uniref:GU4 nucleic-binding protein 1 n=1 Tax=Arthroderma gypseum (strain ATCC MYA-4604 / CBS 118893) TaxID=535722 RepID=E4UVV4_ARTGP|nr:GU4 nucleic-binding protein 1 [Nannizzia gypsea CBS 118893]EFR02431.1 GU4 nucleic-binding protein 1 [Nannizzia gypsea CBS 118893]